ncbi:RsiV family protein [Mycobacterium sp. MYCO198283]|uniref:esterase n=1 Tax=Mycobacterium sp. MYCO198283 TaxID=2883505 RepID=UPI001E646D48|nr:esterase [Mycobacterium sp. MYCO198283]MCG5434361.1 RsiV family protein [Mycobacterium sp. MYCO198283]
MRTSALFSAAAATALLTLGGLTAPASAQPPCGDLGGVVDGGTCRIDTHTAAYGFSASYPLDYPDEAALTAYVRETRDGFVNVADGPSASRMPYELDITTRDYRSGRIRSVVFEVYQNVGAAHPLTWYKSFNYDTAAKAPLSFEQLWAPGAQPMPAVLRAVQREVDRQLSQPVAIDPEDGLDPAHYQNFAVTDDALILFFGQGEFLPSAAGAVSVAVPRAELPPLAR